MNHEPVEERIPSRKRSGTVSTLREVAQKKIKADPENPSMAGVDVKPPPMSTETMRNELTDLQAKINHLQPQLDRARRKNWKSIEQLTREKSLTGQLIALNRRKKELTEMIPAIAIPAHPIPGPSYRNGFVDGFVQPSQPPPMGQPFITSAPVASGSNLPSNTTRDEPMDTDSGDDDANPPLTLDVDQFYSFEDDKNQMLVDGTNLGLEFYQYNTAKADEWVQFLAFYFPPPDVPVLASNDISRSQATLIISMAMPKWKRL